MNEYILIFRLDINSPEKQPTPSEMNEYMTQWQKWVSGISAKNRLAPGGNHLSREGKVINSEKIVSEGPFTETKESVAGYLIVRAANFQEAVAIAEECPILDGAGNSVEVRKIEPN